LKENRGLQLSQIAGRRSPAASDFQEVVIPADQTSFSLVLTAGPNSQPGTFGVRVSSSASLMDRKDNQEFKIPDLKASLDVLAGSAALK
jgi:hypothetical protein